MSAEALDRQRERLLRLQVDVDQRLAAVEAALRIFRTKSGRPRLPLTMTFEDAKRARMAYRRGDRSAWAITGRREYERHNARRRRP